MIVIFHFTLLIDDQSMGWPPFFGPVYLFSRGKQQSDLNATSSIFGGIGKGKSWQKRACFGESQNGASKNLDPLHNCTGRRYFFADT